MITYLISGIWKSYQVIKKDGCKLIHAHWVIPTGFIAILVGRILRIPVIVSAHGSDILVFSRKSSLLKKVAKFVLRKANLLTSNAYPLTKEMVKLDAPQEKIAHIVLGIDPEEFSGTGFPVRERNTVISVRNLTPLYNVRLLIKAIPFVVKEIPQVKFIIAGDGSKRRDLEKLHKELKIEKYVDFVGSLSHSELLRSLASSNIYVSTSLSDGTSLSLLEAMYYGTFPVVTKIPANWEWIKDGENGFLVPANDEEMLGRKIVEALRNSDLRESARKINRRIVEEKALWPDNIRKLENLYSSLPK
jgi:glycosyltransferase involved in cell wall biosynthesis